jgi:hypothetical protein
MKADRDLEISGEQADLDQLTAQIEASLSNGWSHDTSAEQGLSQDYLIFRALQLERRPAATL